jgi:phosphoribosylformylglycinamidine cyclo-ligase
MTKRLTYKGAGVDIDEGALLVKLIKPAVRSTRRAGVLSDIGGFGALFSGRFTGLKDPVLVSSTDGVGTKLMIAFKAGMHDTVGVDLVAMSVNDLLVAGAEPLFFLDYMAVGKLSAKKHARVVKGVVRGCREAGCALIGGETAEMPGLYGKDEYDLAGFAVGVVDKSKIIDGARVRAGDSIIGLASSGLHSNGYTLARKVLFERMGLTVKSRPGGFGKRTLGTALLTPTRIYVRPVLRILKRFEVQGMAHITGGGFYENIPRVLPRGLGARIFNASWKVPKIFHLIAANGKVKDAEMLRTFNCGIGFVIIVRPKDADRAIKALKTFGERAYEIGVVQKTKRGGKRIEFEGGPLFR